MNEWKFASRKILGSLGGSLTIVLALAIAVGINATIYTLAENFISAGRNDSFFLIGARPVDPKLDYIYMFDTQMLEAVEQNVKSFKSLIRMAPYEFALSNVGRPLMLNGLRVGAGSPDALPVRVMNGRMFAADDFDPAAEKTALITHYAWANAYGRSEDAIGKLIAINGVSHRIIGILPDDFSFHQEKFDLVSASSFREPTYLGLGGPDVWLVGRLRDGVSVEQANAELKSMEPALSRIAPGKYFEENSFRVRTVGGWSHTIARTQVDVLLAAGFIMMLLATLTLCTFALVQMNRRRADYATRVVMGAKWWHLLRLFTIENGTTTFIGCTLGVFLGYFLVQIVRTQFAGAEMGLLALVRGFIQFNWRIVGLCLLGCGAVLALISLTTYFFLSPRQLSKFIREDSYTATGSKAFKWMCNGLLFIQTAATCVIAIVGIFFLLSLSKVIHYDYGYSPAGIIQADVHLPYYRFAAGEKAPELAPMMNSVVESVRSLPEVRQVSVSKLQFPHWGFMLGVRLKDTPANLEARRLPRVRTGLAGPGFPELIGLRKVRGEFFSEVHNRPGSEKVVVINQAFADRYFKGKDPLAEFVQAGSTRYRVIGVASNVRRWQYSNGVLQKDEGEPAMYLPEIEDQQGSWTYLYIRTDQWNAGLEQRIRKSVHDVDADVVVGEFGDLKTRLERSENTYRLIVFAQGVVAILGCILSCMTIYSALSYSVTLRRREMGIRIALGATPGGITGGVIGYTAGLVAPAVVVGLGLSYVLLVYLGIFKTQLYLVNIADLRVYLAGSAVLLLIGVLAGLHPALRAGSSDPNELLRST